MTVPTRLLMTVDAVGGVWQYAADLAQALVPLGIATTLALVGPPPSPRQRAELADLPLIETGLPLDWLSDAPAPVLAAGAALAATAREGRFDLVQLNTPAFAAGGAFAMPVVAAAHGCLATWWAATEGGELPAALDWQRRLHADGLRAATRVVAPTRAFAAEVRRCYDLQTMPHVVHNGRRALVRTIAPANQDHVLTVGRLWDRAKNVRLLDRAAARLAVPFYAAGAMRGPHGETIALDHLHPLGQLDERALAAALAKRPVFVSAATFEPFGLAVLEAAAAGCALVLSDIPSFRELWGGAALFVAPGDEAGFSTAVDTLIGDASRRDDLARHARARALQRTPEATARAMAALYAGLLPARRAAA